MFSNTFAGIAPSSAPAFIGAQVIGGVTGFALVKVLFPGFTPAEAATVVGRDDDGPQGSRPLGNGRRLAGELGPRTGPREIELDHAPSRRRCVTEKPVVLFLCTHNAGRSLAASVLLDHYAQGQIEVRSAGSEPADQLNPAVVAVLRERGLDPSREFPKPLTDDAARASDVIVTMGCGDTCPFYPGKRYVDWGLEDPAGKPVDAVRAIVDDIDRRVQALLADLGGRAEA